MAKDLQVIIKKRHISQIKRLVIIHKEEKLCPEGG